MEPGGIWAGSLLPAAEYLLPGRIFFGHQGIAGSGGIAYAWRI